MLVSVLINNYNYSKYIDRCIESVLRQTYNNVEIIVYDDGSTDESLQVLKQYEQQLILLAEKNYGHTPNLNQANAIYQAFLRSKGDIICLLDSDDEFHQNKIEKIAKTFEKNEKICAIQNLLQEIDSNDNISSTIRPVLKDVNNIKAYIYENQSLSHLFVATSGLSFRRSLLEKALPLKEDARSYVWPDARLMIQSVFYGDIVSLREPLTYYRIHGTNDSNARGTLDGHNRYLEQFRDYFNETAQEYGYAAIHNDQRSYLENTFFYSIINRDKLLNFCRTTLESDGLWIWGAGEAGQSIAHFLTSNQFKFSGFIDSNAARKDEVIMGRRVYTPESVTGGKYIISPYHAFDAISRTLQEQNLEQESDYINPYQNQEAL